RPGPAAIPVRRAQGRPEDRLDFGLLAHGVHRGPLAEHQARAGRADGAGGARRRSACLIFASRNSPTSVVSEGPDPVWTEEYAGHSDPERKARRRTGALPTTREDRILRREACAS